MYQPKKILITGGCGFIASHVIIHLVKNYPEYNIVNIDRLSYCSSLNNVKEIENELNYKFYLMDITSVNEMDKIFELGKQFLDLKTNETKIFYIWGHTYEFDAKDSWGRMEEFLEMMSGRDDISYCTNKEALLNL